jgi:hypothetical protein
MPETISNYAFIIKTFAAGGIYEKVLKQNIIDLFTLITDRWEGEADRKLETDDDFMEWIMGLVPESEIPA